jgi:hypothetical protein
MNAFEVYGVKGLKSKPFRKSFKSDKARTTWINKNIEDITVFGYADPEPVMMSGLIPWPVETRDEFMSSSPRQANHRSPFGMFS